MGNVLKLEIELSVDFGMERLENKKFENYYWSDEGWQVIWSCCLYKMNYRCNNENGKEWDLEKKKCCINVFE